MMIRAVLLSFWVSAISLVLVGVDSCDASQPITVKHFFVGQSYAPRIAPDESAQKTDLELKHGQSVNPTESTTDNEGVAWLGWMHDGKPVWLPEALVSAVPTENLREGNLPIGEERVDRWRALPLDYAPTDLVPLDRKFAYYSDRECLMRVEAAQSAIKFLSAAKEDGHELRVVSSYRPVSVQRDLYLKKIESAGYGQQTVARPGNSEHQLGTAMDINGLDEDTVVVESFGETAEGKWAAANCQRFGFVLSYTKKNGALTGYEPEPWHFRYVGIEKASDWQPLGPPEQF